MPALAVRWAAARPLHCAALPGLVVAGGSSSGRAEKCPCSSHLRLASAGGAHACPAGVPNDRHIESLPRHHRAQAAAEAVSAAGAPGAHAAAHARAAVGGGHGGALAAAAAPVRVRRCARQRPPRAAPPRHHPHPQCHRRPARAPGHLWLHVRKCACCMQSAPPAP